MTSFLNNLQQTCSKSKNWKNNGVSKNIRWPNQNSQNWLRSHMSDGGEPMTYVRQKPLKRE